MRKRRFVRGECNHVYQRTVEGFNIFYDRADYLLCLMILSVTAKSHGVRLIMICFMVDHIHILVETESCEKMADFVRDYSSVFVHEYNVRLERKGQLFYKSFGSAPKKGDKKTRSAIVYIGNNPVEKLLCVHPESYRWNLIAYMDKSYPFSFKPESKKMSRPLKRALGVVKAAVAAGRYVNSRVLELILSPLGGNDLEYFTDYVVSSYFPIDRDGLLEYYDDFMQMRMAMRSSTGSDYDIHERFSPGSDMIYAEMADVVSRMGIHPVGRVTVMDMGKKMKVGSEIRKAMPWVKEYQLRKFLHIKNGDTHHVDNHVV